MYTSPLPTLRRHKATASLGLLAFVGGRLHTRHTAHESYAYRLLRQKKKIFNSEEARARDEGDGTVQIRDLEPTTALSFGQGQRSSMHCLRAVSDPQRFSPPKPLWTFRAISMMTSIEQSSMKSAASPREMRVRHFGTTHTTYDGKISNCDGFQKLRLNGDSGFLHHVRERSNLFFSFLS